MEVSIFHVLASNKYNHDCNQILPDIRQQILPFHVLVESQLEPRLELESTRECLTSFSLSIRSTIQILSLFFSLESWLELRCTWKYLTSISLSVRSTIQILSVNRQQILPLLVDIVETQIRTREYLSSISLLTISTIQILSHIFLV